MFLGVLITEPDEGSDRRRRGVEDAHTMAFDDVPEAIRTWMRRDTLVHQARYAIGKDSVDHVGVPGNPTDIGSAPIGVGLVQVEQRLGGRRDMGEVTARGMQDALGLSGRSARIQNEERMLGVELGGSALRAGLFHEIVPPVVAPRLPCDFFARSLDDHDVLYRVEARDGFVYCGFQRVR